MTRKDEYLRLHAAEEDLEDVRLYDEAKAKPSEFIPLELTERMLNGESPIRVYREYRGFTQDNLREQARSASRSSPRSRTVSARHRSTPSSDSRKRCVWIWTTLSDRIGKHPLAPAISPDTFKSTFKRAIHSTSISTGKST